MANQTLFAPVKYFFVMPAMVDAHPVPGFVQGAEGFLEFMRVGDDAFAVDRNTNCVIGDRIVVAVFINLYVVSARYQCLAIRADNL